MKKNTINSAMIKEIAEWLDCGMACFYNPATGDFDYHPDPLTHPDYDEEQWTEVTDKVNSSNYLRFEGMETGQAIRMMADFAEQVQSFKIRENLIDALSRRKPFQQFKALISCYPDLQEQWFKYKADCYIAFVEQSADGMGLIREV